MSNMTDWRAWHEQYDDEAASLSQRLRVVQARLDEVLNGTSGHSWALCLCAGDGRDIIPALARRRPEQRPTVTLVEIDPVLAAAATERAAAAGVDVTVLVADAGSRSTWEHVLPVDLLTLCGIFGNVSDDDIRTCIDAALSMLTPNGTVVWTRGSSNDVDLRPVVRQWFRDAGFDEIGFDGGAAGYGVGANRAPSTRTGVALASHLFTFLR
jgi:hypothetical protein